MLKVSSQQTDRKKVDDGGGERERERMSASSPAPPEIDEQNGQMVPPSRWDNVDEFPNRAPRSEQDRHRERGTWAWCCWVQGSSIKRSGMCLAPQHQYWHQLHATRNYSITNYDRYQTGMR